MPSQQEIAFDRERSLVEMQKVADQHDEAQRARGLYLCQQGFAVEFGRLHGWRLSDTSFTIEALVRRKGGSGRSQYFQEPPSPLGQLFDHLYFYREWQLMPASSCRTSPATAIVAHPYRSDRQLTAAEATQAAKYKLKVSWPTDFPSWWSPGSTILCLIEPTASDDRRSARTSRF